MVSTGSRVRIPSRALVSVHSGEYFSNMCSGGKVRRCSYRYRLRPTRRQRQALERTGHARRFVYNWALERSRSHYLEHGRGVSLTQQCRALTQLKGDPLHAWLREVDSQALQQAIFDLRRGYSAFFDGRGGLPRFRSRRTDPLRFRIPRRVVLQGDRIYAPKIGWVRLRLSRPVQGKLKSASFKCDPCGNWYVSVVAEVMVARAGRSQSPSKRAGIDLGVVDFAVISDGTRIPNPRFQRRPARKLRRLHRQLNRKQAGSRNRARAHRKLAREHVRLRNKRLDFLHKLSSKLVADHAMLCIEDLSVSGFARTKLARAVQDSGLREFRTQLEYKADWQGKVLFVAPRFYPSSKLCSRCGELHRGLGRRERTWVCACGATHDRDLNAARNLLHFGLAKLVAAGPADTKNACGADMRLPPGAVSEEARIRNAEGQHGGVCPDAVPRFAR